MCMKAPSVYVVWGPTSCQAGNSGASLSRCTGQCRQQHKLEKLGMGCSTQQGLILIRKWEGPFCKTARWRFTYAFPC